MTHFEAPSRGHKHIGHKFRSTMKQKLVQIFLTRTWSFWKQHTKETAKATSKIEKYVCYIFTENMCSTCNPMQEVVFCKHVLIL